MDWLQCSSTTPSLNWCLWCQPHRNECSSHQEIRMSLPILAWFTMSKTGNGPDVHRHQVDKLIRVYLHSGRLRNNTKNKLLLHVVTDNKILKHVTPFTKKWNRGKPLGDRILKSSCHFAFLPRYLQTSREGGGHGSGPLDKSSASPGFQEHEHCSPQHWTLLCLQPGLWLHGIWA